MPGQDHTQLSEYLNAIHTLKPEESEAFCAAWQPVTVKRKTLLTAAGETERYLYFVCAGVQRAFYMDDNGKEATVVFTYPYSFGGVADSFLTKSPSIYFYESLTASSFLRISHDVVTEFSERYPNLRQLLLLATGYALKGALHRQIELQCYTSEEKFLTLLRRSPHLLQLVPHKYLASYLGIDATNFSKLLSTVKI